MFFSPYFIPSFGSGPSLPELALPFPMFSSKVVTCMLFSQRNFFFPRSCMYSKWTLIHLWILSFVVLELVKHLKALRLIILGNCRLSIACWDSELSDVWLIWILQLVVFLLIIKWWGWWRSAASLCKWLAFSHLLGMTTELKCVVTVCPFFLFRLMNTALTVNSKAVKLISNN